MQYKTISCPHLFPSPKNLAGQIFRLAPNRKREVCKAAASGGFAAACASLAIKSKRRVFSVRALSENLAGQIFPCSPTERKGAARLREEALSLGNAGRKSGRPDFSVQPHRKKGRFEATGRGAVPGQCRTKIWPARFFSAAPVERKGAARPREEALPLDNAGQMFGTARKQKTRRVAAGRYSSCGR